ncbi:MAG TPA: nucleoside-diphosphate sugar epimerase/dehydratase [Candidatus Krumholzibacteria bacterium]|nr:nucleoside-diphosphate sugar epimerase/dehydratase [Candidatus Krumholzibacteria bacterium]
MLKRLIIVGAGEAGRMLARDVANRAPDQYLVAGFLDDDAALAGTSLDGFRVLGATAELPAVVAREHADEVLIAVPSAGREFVRRIVTLCRDASIPYRIVPGLLEIIKGPVHLEQIRDVRPEDLLGRETVEFEEGEIEAFLAGRTVLVTGAGGSIGSEICRQVSRFDIRRLILLGRGENQIFEIERELRETRPGRDVVPVIIDVRDRDALARVFEEYRPEIVYHTAAHKHVHYMEAFPSEAVKNNIGGTVNVIDAARAVGTARVVMLSTDKAACPQGVMGATKRVAEFLMSSRGRAGDPRLISVRFGNVLASRGSVVPLFVTQIRAGGPVTVSHEDATRFFMSIKEACMLVVQASLMGEGGEIFILKMGDPIRIAELARDLIALHGLRPGTDVKIEYTGLRPGEKLHESLVADGEEAVPSPHSQILRAVSRVPDGLDLDAVLSTLQKLAAAGDDDGVRAELARVIPDSAFPSRPVASRRARERKS